MGLPFIKMHGISNNFVIVDCRKSGVMPDKKLMIAIMHRQTGVGCDQVIPIMPPETPGTDAFMRIVNYPTGNEAEACGNATRCVADYLMNDKGTDRVVIQTLGGLLECTRAENGLITVDMGVPRLEWHQIPVAKQCDTLHMPLKCSYKRVKDLPVGVNVGNPHAVFFVDDVDDLPVAEIGPELENDPFFPVKANIEFAKVLDRNTIRMRVWERDTGETQACGSASCATVVAGVRRGFVDRRCNVILNGGTLNFYWRETDNHLFMTGPVSYVFKGEMLFG